METGRINIAVTSVGAPPGLNALKSLKKYENTKLIGMDADETCATFFYDWCKPYQVPYATDQRYLQRILDICKKEHIHVLISCYEPETEILSKNIELLRRNKIATLIPKYQIVNKALDKYLTMNVAAQLNIDHPTTQLLSEFNLDMSGTYPLVLKPRKSSGSRGFYLVENREEFENTAKKIEEKESYIVQEYIPGEDGTVFMVGLMYDKKSVLKATYVSQGLKSMYRNGGPATIGITIQNEELIKKAVSLIEGLGGYTGPAGVEFKYDKRSDRYKLMEINPRLWGYASLAYGTGIDFAWKYVQLSLDEDIPFQDDYMIGKVMVRSYDDMIVDEASFNRINKK